MVDGKKVLNFCSNNYLGLANHPPPCAGGNRGDAKVRCGPGAVRSIAGTMSLHLQLEKRMAAFKKVEAAITFQSGFSAKRRPPSPPWSGKEDVIFSDALNHASIIDGSRLSGAKNYPFRPRRPGGL